ncbi:MAG: 2Fe-2S iron-sulfur cluster-binding protein [Streptosporangiaceae bacterium]|jgi:carbon-monoxide dehydrogenase small subunit
MSDRRTVKFAADELADVSFTVNGTPVRLRVPPRMHLADALRTQLGLTGTHLGCEHGVCGMCTVLLDGDAARSCLVFAVQAEGGEIITVEGLGTPAEQHPLQQSFSHHHALQCGFCTPGFLMSSYDLLTHERGADREHLAADMSGVICRCTGYRGILDAVADVADSFPGGIPEPLNCAPRTLAGPGLQAAAKPADGDASPAEAGREPNLIVRPSGSPTITVQVNRELPVGIDDVWRAMSDVGQLAACLPGARMTAELGGDRYRGQASVALGPVKLAFEGIAQITDRDGGEHRLAILARGADKGGNRTSADIRLQASPTSSGVQLRVDADVFLSGRIAQFGRAMAGDVSRRLFEQFAASLEQAARTGAAPIPVKSPSALLIGARATFDALQRRTDRLRTLVRRRIHRYRSQRGRSR